MQNSEDYMYDTGENTNKFQKVKNGQIPELPFHKRENTNGLTCENMT